MFYYVAKFNRQHYYFNSDYISAIEKQDDFSVWNLFNFSIICFPPYRHLHWGKSGLTPLELMDLAWIDSSMREKRF